MSKIGIIDIGSNSVRLMLLADGKVLYKRLNTTRLGEGLAFSGALNPQAIERSVSAIDEFYRTAKNEGAENVYAFATNAVRSAKNKDAFSSALKERCPVPLEIVSGEKEALLGVFGALGKKDGGIIDIGGGSTEIVFRKSGETLYKKSVDVGVVRLFDLAKRDYDKLKEIALNEADKFGKVPFVVPLTAIGGTATTLAVIKTGITVYSAEKVTGVRFTKAEISALASSLIRMTPEEIAQNPCIPFKRAEVIAGGAVWLSAVMEVNGFDEITVSDRDNLEGYAVSIGALEL